MANRLGICKDCSKVIHWETSKNGKEHPRNENGKTHGCRMRRMGEKKSMYIFRRVTHDNPFYENGNIVERKRTYVVGKEFMNSYSIPSSVNL